MIESGEQLVVIDGQFQCMNLYRRDGWAGTCEDTYVRESVRDRLRYAEQFLPAEFRIAIFDAWRSMETVRALYRHFYGPGSDLPPGFLANPDDEGLAPPHNTGAAVDVTLAYRGQPLALGTYFDDFTPAAHFSSLEDRDATAEPSRSLRRLLYAAMTAADFVGFSGEWWHYSYGDQEWAWQKRQPSAIFGMVDAPPT